MIKIAFDIDNYKRYDFDIEKLSKKIAKTTFDIEKVKYDVSLSLSLVTKKKIKSINKSERNIDKDTDVLSFPNIDFKKPSDFKPFVSKKDIDVSIVDLNTKTIFLGDVVICKDVMERQAKAYGHTIKREFAFLFTHSLLHLLGYDHVTKALESKMFKKQDKILRVLHINR